MLAFFFDGLTNQKKTMILFSNSVKFSFLEQLCVVAKTVFLQSMVLLAFNHFAFFILYNKAKRQFECKKNI